MACRSCSCSSCSSCWRWCSVRCCCCCSRGRGPEEDPVDGVGERLVAVQRRDKSGSREIQAIDFDGIVLPFSPFFPRLSRSPFHPHCRAERVTGRKCEQSPPSSLSLPGSEARGKQREIDSRQEKKLDFDRGRFLTLRLPRLFPHFFVFDSRALSLSFAVSLFSAVPFSRPLSFRREQAPASLVQRQSQKEERADAREKKELLSPRLRPIRNCRIAFHLREKEKKTMSSGDPSTALFDEYDAEYCAKATEVARKLDGLAGLGSAGEKMTDGLVLFFFLFFDHRALDLFPSFFSLSLIYPFRSTTTQTQTRAARRSATSSATSPRPRPSSRGWSSRRGPRPRRRRRAAGL